MIGFVVIWCFIVFLSTLLCICRCEYLLYAICLFPIILSVIFLLFKNEPLSNEAKFSFFKSFSIGGHRGSPLHAPENSIPSFKKALEEGCDLVEFDIQMTSDGVAVLMHDSNTGRTANKNLDIATTHSSAVLSLELLPVKGVTANIPLLNDTIDWCVSNNIKMLFDLKDPSIEMIDTVVTLFREKDIFHIAIVSSFNLYVPYIIKRKDSRIMTGFTYRRGYLPYEDDNCTIIRYNIFINWIFSIADELIFWGIRTFVIPRFLGVDMLLLNRKEINKQLVIESNDIGIKVVGWTSNDVIEMIWLRDIIQIPFLTDKPYELIDLNNNKTKT